MSKTSLEGSELVGQEMWEPRPQIEGLSVAESNDVYAGNFDPVISRLRAIPDGERDSAVQALTENIGVVERQLLERRDIATEEGHDDQKDDDEPGIIDRYQESSDTLRRFHGAVMELHQGI
jgi:hypothetical protein